MSIAAFYRSWLPFVVSYGTYIEGVWTEVTSPPFFVKGNIQPFKSGAMLTLAEAGIAYKNNRTLYLRKLPELPTLPLDADAVKTYVWIDGNTLLGEAKGWFVVTTSKDYTKANRAVKHYEMTALYASDDQPDGVGEPTPLPELVDEFELIVNELHILTPLVLEVI